MEKAEAAGLELESPLMVAENDPLAMPKRTLRTDAASNPKPASQRNFTDPLWHPPHRRLRLWRDKFGLQVKCEHCQAESLSSLTNLEARAD